MSNASSKTSTVDTTKTTTSTASKTVAANKGPRVRAVQPVLSMAAAQWAVMNGQQRNSYAELTKLVTTDLEPTVPTKKSAYTTFVAMSAANIATGQALQPSAPPYAPALPLPNIQVSAAYAEGRLTLTLFPDAPYPHAVAIKAARPILAANNIYKSTAFKKIGSVSGLSLSTDITALYLSRFHVPGAGYKIALELMGVTPTGYHTSGLFVFGIVSASAAAGLLAEPEATNLKMG